MHFALFLAYLSNSWLFWLKLLFFDFISIIDLLFVFELFVLNFWLRYLTRNWSIYQLRNRFFFEIKSIFSIDWSNSFAIKIWIEFSLKILTACMIFADVEVDIWNDLKYFEFKSFISFKIWFLEVLDDFKWILENFDHDFSNDSENSDDSDDSNDSNNLIDVLMFIWYMITSILDLSTFIDVFLFFRSMKLLYSI